MSADSLRQFLNEHRTEIVEFVASMRPVGQRWLSVKHAATYSGLSVRSVERLLAGGKLRAYRPVRGRLLIDKDELDSVIGSATAVPRKRRGVRTAATS